VIESSGQTVWVLGPEEQRERFRRLLQLQKAELDYDVRYTDALTRPRDDDTPKFRSFGNAQRREGEKKRRKRWRRLLDTAALIGIEQSEFEHGLTGGYEAVIREAADEHNIDRDFHGRQCASTWVYISGLSHPSMWRAWGGSIHEPGELGPDGYMPVWSEANPAITRDSLGIAMALHVKAVQLWLQACAPPPGDDS
jgi:hypothetical protein